MESEGAVLSSECTTPSTCLLLCVTQYVTGQSRKESPFYLYLPWRSCTNTALPHSAVCIPVSVCVCVSFGIWTPAGVEAWPSEPIWNFPDTQVMITSQVAAWDLCGGETQSPVWWGAWEWAWRVHCVVVCHVVDCTVTMSVRPAPSVLRLGG